MYAKKKYGKIVREKSTGTNSGGKKVREKKVREKSPGNPVGHAHTPFGWLPVAMVLALLYYYYSKGKMTSQKKNAGGEWRHRRKNVGGKWRHRKKKTRGKMTSLSVNLLPVTWLTSLPVRASSGSTTTHHHHKCGFVRAHILLTGLGFHWICNSEKKGEGYMWIDDGINGFSKHISILILLTPWL